MRDLVELDDPIGWLKAQPAKPLMTLQDAVATNALQAPNDLQAVKACGVTFARSMIERVIEEKAAGNPDLAETMRAKVTALGEYHVYASWRAGRSCRSRCRTGRAMRPSPTDGACIHNSGRATSRELDAHWR